MAAGCYVGAPAPDPGYPQQPAANPGQSSGRSCFMSYEGRDRQMCEAYREGKSCFMAFRSERDQGWCKHLKERKSCFMALNGVDRQDCEAHRVPRDHEAWFNAEPMAPR